jgi:hypothetical protein
LIFFEKPATRGSFDSELRREKKPRTTGSLIPKKFKEIRLQNKMEVRLILNFFQKPKTRHCNKIKEYYAGELVSGIINPTPLTWSLSVVSLA